MSNEELLHIIRQRLAAANAQISTQRETILHITSQRDKIAAERLEFANVLIKYLVVAQPEWAGSPVIARARKLVEEK